MAAVGRMQMLSNQLCDIGPHFLGQAGHWRKGKVVSDILHVRLNLKCFASSSTRYS